MKSLYSFITFSLLLNGCSILFGQVKPVEVKAKKVPFTDVSVIDPRWKRLDIASNTKGADDISDSAWQSSTTAAIISLNSSCRAAKDQQREDLKEVTRLLLSQWDNLNIQSEQASTLSGFPAWETEALGNYLKSERKFKTIVTKTSTCVYDLIYLSPIKTFDQEVSVFEKFCASLNLK